MKKLIAACGAALMLAATMSSCNNAGKTMPQATTFGDSIAVALGQMQGYDIANMDSTAKAKWDNDAFLKGLKATLMSDTTSEAYSAGMQMGLQMLAQITDIERNIPGVTIDRQKFYQSIAYAITSGDSLDMMKLQMELQSLSQQLQAKAQKAREEAEMAKPEVQKNVKAGEAYIAAQKKADPSIKTTESGLSYKVITQGTGEKPKATDKVKVKYVGKKVDGTEFDSSKGETADFMVRGVIPGFAEGLQMMPVGSKYILYIPGKIAYGANGQQMAGIEPMEMLVFEVELVEIEDPTAPAQPAAQPAK